MGEGECLADKQYICMDKTTGDFHNCAGDAVHSVLCMTEKTYTMDGGTFDPIAARTTCGMNTMLSMPKSQIENTKLLAIIQAETTSGLIMLGATYNGVAWNWDDGQSVCGWTNFKSTTAQTVADPNNVGKTITLCIDAADGKWDACVGVTTKKSLVCETAPQGRTCKYGAMAPATLSFPTGRVPSTNVVLFQEMCYYLGHPKESCTATCQKQINGYCDIKGDVLAAKADTVCYMVANGFGNIVTVGTANDKSYSQGMSSSGCTYIGRTGDYQVLVEAKPSGRTPECGATIENANQHRVCACSEMEDVQ